MVYSVKEIVYTVQGEGAHTGRAAVFCRFTGCNLWSGLEQDRTAAMCKFCDTDFVGVDGAGGYRYLSVEPLATAIALRWPWDQISGVPYVVCTGGEPLLQLDRALVMALHARGLSVAVETNGTCQAPIGLDWICVSPKAGTHLVLTAGDELKLVFPQENMDPAQFTGLQFQHFFLQPKDGPALKQNTIAAIHYCLNYPKWRLSLQVHKFLGLP
ncbi:Queuosine Biosynthesis QueE Radical SAM [invertebrate metagenome]|uniref:Queuosine Biosynthesis QueE Radical SAM n=1 Tax=invertebrate metagenome TaxID=1711999 RepID=A0A484HC10_9ZZZZ